MARPQTSAVTALSVRERILLFCIASGTSWQRAGIPEETVTAMTVRGFISRDTSTMSRGESGARLPWVILFNSRCTAMLTGLRT
jgi:hypothetical protein